MELTENNVDVKDLPGESALGPVFYPNSHSKTDYMIGLEIGWSELGWIMYYALCVHICLFISFSCRIYLSEYIIFSL